MSRLLARTEVDARRELHNGTNNAGDIIFWNGLNFVLFKIWRLPILRKQKYAEKSVELIPPLFSLGSCCGGGEKTFVGRPDRRGTIFGEPGHAG